MAKKAKRGAGSGAAAREHAADRDARGARAGARVLRIIGGQHRGRRLRFPAGVEIRPTPDRVRETLFNWLQPRIVGARVLDLFAGSGALGLEALSRGAGGVTFVEQERRAAAAIEALVREWQESGAKVVCADGVGWLKHTPAGEGFDVVFLDPPYESSLAGRAAALLATGGWLAVDARVYLERRAREPLPALPEGWREIREGRAGEVGYHLFAT